MDWVLRQREKENEWNPQYWDPCPRRPKSGHSFGSISRGLQSRAADALCEVNTEEQTSVASNPIFNLDTPALTPLWVSATLYHHCKYLQHSECRPNCPESECSESGTAPTSKAQYGLSVDLCLFSCRFNSFVVNWWNQYTTMRGRTFKSSIWALTGVYLCSFKCHPNFSGFIGPHL